MSSRFTATAWTRTTTSPGPGWGSGRATSSSTSGPPGRVITTARTGLVGHPAAVDHQVRAAGVAGLGRQVGDGGGDVLGPAQARERRARLHVGQARIVGAQVARGAGHDLARRDRVAQDPVLPV